MTEEMKIKRVMGMRITVKMRSGMSMIKWKYQQKNRLTEAENKGGNETNVQRLEKMMKWTLTCRRN